MDSKTAEFEKIIGYKFKNEKLLYTALTHSSFANEHKKTSVQHNERTEFLGDAVLELISSDILFHKYPQMPEGDLTKLRASLVCEPTLALDAKEINLGKYLFLGKGEEATGGRNRDSVTSDALEAVIGAIYLDGGLDKAYEFVQKFVLNDIEKKKLFSDSKTHLQEMVIAADKGNVLTYEIVGESGPEHNKKYEANVLLGNQVIGNGSGRTKKAAEQQAAYNALKTLG